MSAVVLVTGGAGFVGAAVVRLLAARGAEVHVLGRASTDRSVLRDVPVTWHVGDVLAPAELERALGGAAARARERGRSLDVVHLAARISYRRADRELLRRTNVEGTRNVLAAAAGASVRRFCHVSSVVALGPVARADQELGDDAPLGGLRMASAYARTKAEAEELALAAGRERDVVVASPAVVFGISGAGSNSLHFLGRVARGTLWPFTPPGSISVVDLEDAAEGICRVLERGRRGQRYLLAESAWRLHDLLGLASRLAGRSPPRARLPRPVWRMLVGAVALADRLWASERATPEALALLGMHFRFRAARARAELGWSPRPFPAVLEAIMRELCARARA